MSKCRHSVVMREDEDGEACWNCVECADAFFPDAPTMKAENERLRSPPFVEDDEWPKTRDKILVALHQKQAGEPK